jgi:hypothetical protein
MVTDPKSEVTMSGTRVQTARNFKEIVDEDYAEYKARHSDLRLAYHLALGLFHLREWTFWDASRADPNWPHKSLNDYQSFLEKSCADFGYMRDLANSVKHVELDPTKKPSTQMVGLANTELAVAAFQPGASQPNAFQTRTMIMSQTAQNQWVEFEPAADAVMQMWNDLFAANKW